MPRLGVGVRLSLALLVLVTVALAIVYALVVPDLEDRLLDERRSELARTAELFAQRFGPHEDVENFVDDAARAANARAVMLQEYGAGTPVVYEDSAGTSRALAFRNDPVALETYRSRRLVDGTVRRGETRYVEAAVPLPPDGSLVLMLTAPVDDALAVADVVERRLLTAGVIAALVALALGFGAAAVHARRIGRLRRAADRIASGRFDEPIADGGSDELGELAASFERMRGRLATLDDARRSFVANASHELRTPIFALGAALELLAEEQLDDATRADFVATARAQVDRLTRLATDLLDLSRIDAGRLDVDLGPIDLGDAAAALAAEFDAAGRASDHPISVERDGAAIALGDAERVLRIGRALVENALVHTSAGTHVRIRAGRDDGRAVLIVGDDGPGIPAEHFERVFDRFYRVDSARASGSGLGLAIARELAELMGGSLLASSERGRTTFQLVLPAAPERGSM